MSVSESFEFQNLGDTGLSRVTLIKTKNGYLLRLDEVGEYEVNIELSKKQVLDVLQALDIAKEEAQNSKEGEIQSQPKQIKYICADHENLYKKGFELVKRSNKQIGLTISLERGGDIEPYFSIDTCEEIITLFNRILRS